MIPVNVKKSIRIQNRTKYFNPDTSRTHVRFSSSYSYQSRQIKVEGYETRLYWQYRYCDENDGQTFFYTLTYNDAHIPRHYGINCFDYEDLRNLLCGGFRKMLLRKYGTIFKYFVGAELGDGKGSRGMHNNPHYHILFFLEPANNPKFPYKKIDPRDFRHLVRLYWQGFDESIDGYRSYNDALYGIAREGDNLGKVSDFRACMYCAKYVCKDVKLKQTEAAVERYVRFKYSKEFRESENTYRDYFHTRIYELYNSPLNSKHTKWCFSDRELFEFLCPNCLFSDTEYIELRRRLGIPPDFMESMLPSFKEYVPKVLSACNLWDDFFSYIRSLVDLKVHEVLTEYRNRYCNKCRISHGLGDYALNFISDPLNPSIQVPSKKGFKNRPIGMYYYRKLYTDTVKAPNGNNVYILNELGIQYKLYHLPQQIEKLASRAASFLDYVRSNSQLFENMRSSDINTEVFYHHSDFLRELKRILENDSIKNICIRYAEFKLVYEDRFFRVNCDRYTNAIIFPSINLYDDYKRFLVPTYYTTHWSDFALIDFLSSDCEGYLSYKEHEYFICYLGIFAVLDMCSDYFFIQKDNKSQIESESRATIKRFHDQQKLKEFYSVFK